MEKNIVKVACCQTKQTTIKEENLKSAQESIREAAAAGAKIVVLGEIFNVPYNREYILKSAENLEEPDNSPTYTTLQNAAKENNVSIIGGSIPEREGDKVYNTCLVFSNTGKLLGKFRKLHLFDIDIPGKFTYKESDTFTPGNQLTIIELEGIKFGIGICYDIRFPELALIMRQSGADVLVYPSQFSMTTGELHWDVLTRYRALDIQVYVVACSPARILEEGAPFLSWAHSRIVDPMGKIISSAEYLPAIIYGEIDLEVIKSTRRSIPTSTQKRLDIYEVKKLENI